MNSFPDMISEQSITSLKEPDNKLKGKAKCIKRTKLHKRNSFSEFVKVVRLPSSKAK